MLKICLIIILSTFTSCVAYKKYNRQEIIEQKTNSDGKIVLKKYRQLISSPGGDKVATITQEYDSLGRVIKEYGFGNPYTYGDKYLIQKIYRGSQLYLINKAIWEINDTTFNYLTFDSKLFNQNISSFEEHIYSDTTNDLKNVRISLVKKPNSMFYGQFEETLPDSKHSWTTNYYDFNIEARNISFSLDNKLILESIQKQ